MAKVKRTPRQRLHNPEGGGYKYSQKVHKPRKPKPEDKLSSDERVTKHDILKHLETIKF